MKVVVLVYFVEVFVGVHVDVSNKDGRRVE